MRRLSKGFFKNRYSSAPSNSMSIVIGKTYDCWSEYNWGNILGLIAIISVIIIGVYIWLT